MSDKNGFGMHVVVTGGPGHGYEIIGPFSNAAEAIQWADAVVDVSEWWVLPVASPEDCTASHAQEQSNHA